jgi:hypothetical protein
VLVDAGASISPDDIDLLRRLVDSGCAARVLVAKADLLPPVDRDRFVRFVAEAVTNELGIDVPVAVVSARDASAATWFDRDVSPAVAEARAAADASAARKISRLARVARDLLRASIRPTARADAVARRARVARVAMEAEGRLRAGDQRAVVASDRVRGLARPVLEMAARELVRMLPASAVPTGGEDALRRVLGEAAREAAGWVREEIISARDDVGKAIAALAADVPELATAEPIRIDFLGEPTLELPAKLMGVALEIPVWSRVSRRLKERCVTERLEGLLLADLEAAFGAWERRLRAFAQASLLALGRQLAAALEPARAEPRAGATDVENDVAELSRRLAETPS